jgi:hypothetical protein
MEMRLLMIDHPCMHGGCRTLNFVSRKTSPSEGIPYPN